MRAGGYGTFPSTGGLPHARHQEFNRHVTSGACVISEAFAHALLKSHMMLNLGASRAQVTSAHRCRSELVLYILSGV
jgi:hypothetical protein